MSKLAPVFYLAVACVALMLPLYFIGWRYAAFYSAVLLVGWIFAGAQADEHRGSRWWLVNVVFGALFLAYILRSFWWF